MSVNEIRDFIFENYYKRIGFSKRNSHYSMKRFNETLEKKDCCLQTNFWKKYRIIVILKSTIIYKKEQQKICKTIRNSYLSTKNF